MKPKTEPRIVRNYDLPAPLYEWLEQQAQAERRPVIRQVEVIIERAREAQLQQPIGGQPHG